MIVELIKDIVVSVGGEMVVDGIKSLFPRPGEKLATTIEAALRSACVELAKGYPEASDATRVLKQLEESATDILGLGPSDPASALMIALLEADVDAVSEVLWTRLEPRVRTEPPDFRLWVKAQVPRMLLVRLAEKLKDKEYAAAWAEFQRELLQLTKKRVQEQIGRVGREQQLRLAELLAKVDTLTNNPGALQAIAETTAAALASISRVEANTGDLKRGISEIMATLRAVLQQQMPPSPTLTKRPWFPPRQTTKLFGRRDEIRAVAALLRERQRVAVYGAGGIGKTALAAAVIYHLAPSREAPGVFTGGIFSHDYYQLPDYASCRAAILAQAGLRNLSEEIQDAMLGVILNQADVLLYLEGCEKAEELGRLVSRAGQAQILATTRDSEKNAGGELYSLRPLGREDSVELLRHQAESGDASASSAEAWTELANRLGDHPLALRLAGGWLKWRKQTPEYFLRRMEEEGFEFWDNKKEPKENLRVLFRNSAAAVHARDPRAIAAWFVLALQGYAPVPLAAIATALDDEPDKVEDSLFVLADHSVAELRVLPGGDGEGQQRAWRLTHALLVEWGSTGLKDEKAGALLSAETAAKLKGAWLRWWCITFEDLQRRKIIPWKMKGFPANELPTEALWEAMKLQPAAQAIGFGKYPADLGWWRDPQYPYHNDVFYLHLWAGISAFLHGPEATATLDIFEEFARGVFDQLNNANVLPGYEEDALLKKIIAVTSKRKLPSADEWEGLREYYREEERKADEGAARAENEAESAG